MCKKIGIFRSFLLFFLGGAAFVSVQAAKLNEVQVIDAEHIMLHFLDGEVTHRDDGLGSSAFHGHEHENDNDTVKYYNPALSTSAAAQVSNFTLSSSDDPNYTSATQPTDTYRKTKLNGHAENAWSGSDYQYVSTYAHWIFLKLPQPLTNGKSYTLQIAGGVNSDQSTVNFTWDVNQSRSEAVHVNLVGYPADAPMKSADLYMWMGDGGARDYSSYAGNKVFLYDVNAGTSQEVGTVSFWKANAAEAQNYNLIQSDVWNADFSDFTTPGTYRLVIENVGASQDFRIADDVYGDPFAVSVQGFFYMRIGQDSTGGIYPVPRRPLYIPGEDPANTQVIITTMHPYHSQWSSFGGGDKWDLKDEWANFAKPGNPTNPNAKGGHSDALDWDRHLGHVSIIYDMLLPFILTQGAIDDDNLGIAESGNGIPDILDEAQYEVDFWLNLRDGEGYSHGLNNPNSNNVLYQAGNTAVAAWANAANAAMLAECYRIAGKTSLMEEYRDSAVSAWDYVNGLSDQMLSNTQGVGEAVLQGRDLKMLAAAFLYNVTGETKYEDAVNAENACNSTTCEFDNYGGARNRSQTWAAAGYLMTPRTVNYPTMYNNMKESMLYQAMEKEAGYSATRPSRRGADNDAGYFKTVQNMHRSMIAHAVIESASDRETLHQAMLLEADWGLGRNPMNMIQMTTATTSLENKRSVQGAYTSGRDDGAPGMHPGHTPYMNLDDWYCGMAMGCPSKLYENAYPSNFKNTWPLAEGYFNTRYVWAHVEFTPQQTMRGKTALYGYLYGLGDSWSGPVLSAENPVAAVSGGDLFIHLGQNQISIPQPGMAQIEVLNLQGKSVMASQDYLVNGKVVSLNNQVPGVYLVKITGQNYQRIDRVLLR